jgi:hypothetical protein
MKLSEILGWKVKIKRTGDDITFNRAFNTALTSCDREIDREALEEILMNPSNSKENNINFGVVNDYKARYLANAIISTMPTWLKPTERK